MHDALSCCINHAINWSTLLEIIPSFHVLGLNVPRRRFLPVKKTSDLLVVMSNLYAMKNGSLVMSSKRSFPAVPLVKLGDNHFGKVREFLRRFASIPDVIELDHLTVSGDVTFGKGVELKANLKHCFFLHRTKFTARPNCRSLILFFRVL